MYIVNNNINLNFSKYPENHWSIEVFFERDYKLDILPQVLFLSHSGLYRLLLKKCEETNTTNVIFNNSHFYIDSLYDFLEKYGKEFNIYLRVSFFPIEYLKKIKLKNFKYLQIGNKIYDNKFVLVQNE